MEESKPMLPPPPIPRRPNASSDNADADNKTERPQMAVKLEPKKNIPSPTMNNVNESTNNDTTVASHPSLSPVPKKKNKNITEVTTQSEAKMSPKLPSDKNVSPSTNSKDQRPLLPPPKEPSSPLTPPPPPNNSDDCIITVIGFEKNVTEEDLKLHFENKKKSRGGPVESVSIIDGAAVVHFKQASDACAVLNKLHLHKGQFLTVASFAKSIIPNMFVVSGLSPTTTHELLKDFLESKTNHAVEDSAPLGNNMVLVTFSEASTPEYSDLKGLFESNTLDDFHLKVTQHHLTNNNYDEPIDQCVIPEAKDKIRFIQTYQLEEAVNCMEDCTVKLKFDTEAALIILQGRTGDLSVGKECMIEILGKLKISEYRIERPGIYAFLKSNDAEQMRSSLEKGHNCTIFVEEDIYEHIDGFYGTDSGTDTDSNPSGGSFKGLMSPNATTTSTASDQQKGETQPEDNYGVVRTSKEMGQFKIGKCQFLLKEGQVETEDSDCIVNITPSEIDQGDIWNFLNKDLQKDLTSQFILRGVEWRRKGIVASTVTGLPCKYIIHVSLKQCKGDLVKAIMKCLIFANTMKGVNSVSFFSLGTEINTNSKLFVEAISKFQKAQRLTHVDVRLVLDKMAESFIAEIQQDVETRRDKKKAGFWSYMPNPFRSKPQLPSPIEPAKVIPETPLSADAEQTAVNDEIAYQNMLLDDTDAVIYICSLSESTNQTVFGRLDQFCCQQMQPKVLNDPRIASFTKQQVRNLRQTAGRKVKVDIDTEGCRLEIQGFPKDVDRVYSALLDTVSGTERSDATVATGTECSLPAISTNKETTNKTEPVHYVTSESRQEDEDDTFGKHVANELRHVTDRRKKRMAKLEIQRILCEAQD